MGNKTNLKNKTFKCVNCGCNTKGSVSYNGIKWRMLCGRCKNIDDLTLIQNIKYPHYENKN